MGRETKTSQLVASRLHFYKKYDYTHFITLDSLPSRWAEGEGVRFSGAIKCVSILVADKFIVEFATRITKNANYTTTRWQISIFGMNSVPLPLLSFYVTKKKKKKT